ncbi:hypothetical protein [Kurthia gibsonii]|uniref:hypothetical protein n=1 Tax=Kurthia gibsonii TaxID=33946 RepID=UPI0031B7191D
MKSITTVTTIILGIVIIFAPTITTGHGYNDEKMMGALLVADYTLRVVSLIIGLLVISFAIRGLAKN